jgi:hypothetical protein
VTSPKMRDWRTYSADCQQRQQGGQKKGKPKPPRSGSMVPV